MNSIVEKIEKFIGKEEVLNEEKSKLISTKTANKIADLIIEKMDEGSYSIMQQAMEMATKNKKDEEIEEIQEILSEGGIVTAIRKAVVEALVK